MWWISKQARLKNLETKERDIQSAIRILHADVDLLKKNMGTLINKLTNLNITVAELSEKKCNKSVEEAVKTAVEPVLIEKPEVVKKVIQLPKKKRRK